MKKLGKDFRIYSSMPMWTNAYSTLELLNTLIELIKKGKLVEYGSILTVCKRSPMNSAGYRLRGVVYDFKDGQVCYKNKLHRCDSVPFEDILEVHRTMSIDELLTSNDSTLRALGKRLFEGRDPVWNNSPCLNWGDNEIETPIRSLARIKEKVDAKKA